MRSTLAQHNATYHQRAGFKGLTCSVASSFEELPFGQEEWDAAVERLGGSVYMTWDWIRTWWEFYGDTQGVRLFWFTADGSILGLLPCYVRRIGPPGMKLTVARLVGANIPPKVFDPPLQPEYAEPCLAAAVSTLIDDGCDVVSIGPVSLSRKCWASVDPGAFSKQYGIRSVLVSSGVHTLFKLAGSLEAYLGRLGKKDRKKRKYELRVLENEYNIRLVVHRQQGTELDAAFDRFAALHAAQWRREGLTGHFAAWPRATEYNRALTHRLAKTGRTRILELWAGQEHIGGQYAFAWGDRWFWELPARAVGGQWDRLSLGPALLLLLLDEASREGRSVVEGGLGHYEYKLRLGGEEQAAVRLRFLRRGSAVALRRFVHCLAQWLLRTGYHKIWYRRIQPRIPSRWKRPQSELWLAYDF